MTMIAPSPPQVRQGGAVSRHVYAAEGAWLMDAMKINREETALRKELQESQQQSFSDLLFNIALMLADIRKARAAEHPKNVWRMNLQALTQLDDQHNSRHEREVWFPPAAPRGVPSPARPIQQFIPRHANPVLSALVDEEKELREWVDRLEEKLRHPIERGCVDSWLLITGPQRTMVEEEDNRADLLEEEACLWKRIVNRHKHILPAAYFTDLANAKREALRQELLANPETAESLLRQEIEDEANESKKEMYQWLHEKYGVRLYSTSRIEVSYRSEIEDEEADNCVSKLALRFCEQNFRCSRLALLCLHTTPSRPLLIDFITVSSPELLACTTHP